MTIRTRIAPSPTGDPHVGTAYVALFNYVFAKKHGGQFILRIEDTDRIRSSIESEKNILDALRWLGLNWDEGPEILNSVCSYRQSERGDVYQKYAEQLIKDGHAFRCFCTKNRLDELRMEQTKEKQSIGYDGQCLQLDNVEITKNIENKIPFVVRMKIPNTGVCQIDDMLRDSIQIEWSQVDMQILLKEDGMPTYHLANVVDDHLMKISHVIRGEEWINSAPKHQLLYQYFGWEMPVLCHLPLLRNPDKSKLSKRKNPTSITYYRDAGFLPEALLNYLGRMGWSMPDEREKFTLNEMVEQFDIQRISLGGPVFDQEKLAWLNGLWIRELTDNDFSTRLRNWLSQKQIEQCFPLAQKRIQLLSDFAPLCAFMLSGRLNLTEEMFEHKKMDIEIVKKVLQFTIWRFESIQSWNKQNLFEVIKHLAQEMNIKLGIFNHPIFIAIAGTSDSWSIMDSMSFLGSSMTLARLRHAVETIGGISKKNLKSLEKEYRQLSMGDH